MPLKILTSIATLFRAAPDPVLAAITSMENRIMTAMDNLQAAEAREIADDAKLIDLVTGLVASNKALAEQLAAANAANDSAGIQAVADALTAQATAAEAAIAAATPAPAAAPAAPAA